MAYRLAWILGVGSVVLLLAWLLSQLEPYQDVELSGYRGAARHNRFFAAETFLDRVEIPARSARELSELFPLPPVSVAIVSTTTREGLPDARSEQLLEWVRRGGHLWVIPETWYGDEPVPDAILETFGIHAGVVDDDERPAAASADDPHETDITGLELDGGRIIVDWGWAYETLEWSAAQPPAWSAAVQGHPVVAEYRLGDGVVTVSTDLYFANNDMLDTADNAAGLWYLLTRHRIPDQVIFVLSDDMPSLLRWLGQRAGPALIAGLVLLLLALWRVMPRFGPMQQHADHGQRSLGQHLSASGRYYRRTGQATAQIEQLRRTTWQRLRRRFRELPAQVAESELPAIAVRLQVDPQVVWQAFAGDVARDDQLGETLRALQMIRNPDRHGHSPRAEP